MASAIVSASTGVISTLLPKLSRLIEGDYKLEKGVTNKIAFLRDELSSMQTLLVKLANHEERLDVQLKDWRNKVRDLSYDIEDCIDLFMHKMTKEDVEVNLIKKAISMIQKIWSRHKIANLIDELKARVEEEGHRRKRYRFDDTNFSHVVQIDPRLPALFVEAERLVGIDGPMEKIIQFLKDDDCGQRLKVVSIVGFGGLGKTTLANQIYQKIKGQFHCSCLAPVSRNPNIAKILVDMLKELGGCVDPSDDERQLIYRLRALLQDKRYFVIIDDIWSTQAWELVKSALPENNLNSRIITTTRITDVATSCCSSLAGYVHNIQPLSNQQSKQLFSKRVFGDAAACPRHLEEVSHRILEKCHGLPLAIITVASLLVGKSNKDRWEQVYNSINSAFSHQGMRDILLLSYYDLPDYLKTCLLYLSMYPEDYKIKREELIWRWIAEGFITEVRGQSVEETAESYFNELVNRSLIQPIDIQYDGKAEACRVHDMVFQLIVSLSAEEHFACIVDGKSYSGSGHKIRRLSVQSEHVGDEVTLRIMDKLSQVRSISFYGFQEQITSHLQELHHLRALVFQYYSRQFQNQHIQYIGSLFQLKFLAIHCKFVSELPNDIGNLRCLRILNIRGTRIRKLPPSIGHLQKLVRLLLESVVELPDEIGYLRTLQELSSARIFSTKLVEALRGLTRLKTLNMYVPSRGQLDCDIGRYEEALKSSLAMMGNHGLQSLTIFGKYFLSEELVDLLCSTAPCLWKLKVWGEGGIAHVPKQMTSLVNLTHLSLVVATIKQEDLCTMGAIPALLFCELSISHALDERLTFSSQQFQFLKEFRYYSLFSGDGLEMTFLQGAMPKLRSLDIHFRALETESKMGFEFSFEHLASLEHIKVVILTRDATGSRVEAAEAAVRSAVSMHPGHPTLDMKQLGPNSRLREMIAAKMRGRSHPKDEGDDKSPGLKYRADELDFSHQNCNVLCLLSVICR